jgi:endonuclease YncB( thermonuclease family)
MKMLMAVLAFSLSGGASALHPLGNGLLIDDVALAANPTVVYRKCGDRDRATCVVDGDTLWIDGTKIRVADIDAPEISEPRCASELALGTRATDRLIALINEGPFELHAWPGRDEDRYGRKLRVLIRDGRSLGDILVSEGLARTWSGRRQPWC